MENIINSHDLPPKSITSNSIYDFNRYDHFKEYLDFKEDLDMFKVLKYKLKMPRFVPIHRRNFYIISLITKRSKITIPGSEIDVDSPALFFSNPTTPFKVELMEGLQEGHMCVFSDNFLHKTNPHDVVFDSPLFNIKKYPIYFPDEDEIERLIYLFEQMEIEAATDYEYKHELLQSYVRIILLQTLKNHKLTEREGVYIDAANRIANEFQMALNQQFPIINKNTRIELRSPRQFATHLSVHINHLNSSVQEVTGKTTSQLIAEKLTTEAKALLKTTEWSIDEIAECLGFEYGSYFNKFFKKNTQCTPAAYRKSEFFE